MKPTSITEENYLKAIYHLLEREEQAGTNALAKNLSTSPASVTDMIKRLAEKGLVDYQAYHGVKLTAEGREKALAIVRKHRLWEVFLVKVLHFGWDEIHDTAEQLEHVESPELMRKLDAFLGHPQFDPHGDPIPTEDGRVAVRHTVALSEVTVGQRVTMAGMVVHNDDFLRFLDKIGLQLGVELLVKDVISFDQSMVLQIAEKELVVSGEVARNTLVLAPEI